MLINKSTKIDKGDLVTFKLVNGDELVATVEEVSDNGWTVSRPLTIIPGPQGFGMIPSLFTGNLQERTVFLDKRYVMFHVGTVDQVKAHYTKLTTGLDVPQQGIIGR